MAMDEMPHIIAKENLPIAIDYIEKYNEEFGEYPDVLADLQRLSTDAFGSTIDPMGAKDLISMAFQGEEINEENALELMPQYYYERLDKGYYLFSKGLDQKAFTDDDILPDMARVTSDVGLQLP